MRKVILEAATCSQLCEGGYPVAVCDETGQAIGVVMPPDIYQEMMQLWIHEVFGKEALEEARTEVREQGGYSTAEVLTKLQEIIERGLNQA